MGPGHMALNFSRRKRGVEVGAWELVSFSGQQGPYQSGFGRETEKKLPRQNLGVWVLACTSKVRKEG